MCFRFPCCHVAQRQWTSVCCHSCNIRVISVACIRRRSTVKSLSSPKLLVFYLVRTVKKLKKQFLIVPWRRNKTFQLLKGEKLYIYSVLHLWDFFIFCPGSSFTDWTTLILCLCLIWTFNCEGGGASITPPCCRAVGLEVILIILNFEATSADKEGETTRGSEEEQQCVEIKRSHSGNVVVQFQPSPFQ